MERTKLATKFSVGALIGMTVFVNAAVAAPLSPFDVAYDKNGAAYVKGEMLVKTRSLSALERLLAQSSQQEGMQILSDRKALQTDATGAWYKIKSPASVESLLSVLSKR